MGARRHKGRICIEQRRQNPRVKSHARNRDQGCNGRRRKQKFGANAEVAAAATKGLRIEVRRVSRVTRHAARIAAATVRSEKSHANNALRFYPEQIRVRSLVDNHHLATAGDHSSANQSIAGQSKQPRREAQSAAESEPADARVADQA